jgi:hypothetical protein
MSNAENSSASQVLLVEDDVYWAGELMKRIKRASSSAEVKVTSTFIDGWDALVSELVR